MTLPNRPDREALIERLRSFGLKHYALCPYYADETCTCGLSDALDAIADLSADPPAPRPDLEAACREALSEVRIPYCRFDRYLTSEEVDIILAAIRPALSAAQTGWRDISTAPKDGTRILARSNLAAYVRWVWNSDDPEDGGYWMSEHTHEEFGCDGWFPLPPAPEPDATPDEGTLDYSAAELEERAEFYEDDAVAAFDEQTGAMLRCGAAAMRRTISATPEEGTALADIGRELATQGNDSTAEPMFVVQQRRRVYGFDSRFVDDVVWVTADEGREADEDEAKAVEAEYERHGRREPDNWTRTAYVDQWEFVTACLTRKAAEAFIANQRYNLTDPRVYVESGHRNSEWKRLRAALRQPPPARKGVNR